MIDGPAHQCHPIPSKADAKKTALAPSVRYIAAEWPGEVSRERQLWGELVIKKTWIVIVTIVISSRMGQKHGVMYIYIYESLWIDEAPTQNLGKKGQDLQVNQSTADGNTIGVLKNEVTR